MKKITLILALIGLVGCQDMVKTPEMIMYENPDNMCGKEHWDVRQNETDHKKLRAENDFREIHKVICMQALIKTDSVIEADTRCSMYSYDYASAFVSYCSATGYMDKKTKDKIRSEALDRSMR